MIKRNKVSWPRCDICTCETLSRSGNHSTKTLNLLGETINKGYKGREIAWRGTSWEEDDTGGRC
jgi:hypothetical protein